jgi:hypothetical protein
MGMTVFTGAGRPSWVLGWDVTEDRVGKVCGKEGRGRKKRGPACVQHRAHSS